MLRIVVLNHFDAFLETRSAVLVAIARILMLVWLSLGELDYFFNFTLIDAFFKYGVQMLLFRLIPSI